MKVKKLKINYPITVIDIYNNKTYNGIIVGWSSKLRTVRIKFNGRGVIFYGQGNKSENYRSRNGGQFIVNASEAVEIIALHTLKQHQILFDAIEADA